MLCLTDAALARLVIAATAVPTEARGAWLANLAARAEHPAPASAPASNALRQRRWRARESKGRAVLSIEVDYDALCGALIDNARITEADALSRKQVAVAAASVLADYIARWRE